MTDRLKTALETVSRAGCCVDTLREVSTLGSATVKDCLPWECQLYPAVFQTNKLTMVTVDNVHRERPIVKAHADTPVAALSKALDLAMHSRAFILSALLANALERNLNARVGEGGRTADGGSGEGEGLDGL